MTTRNSKRQKVESESNLETESEPYTLIYWPGIPGRGEHIRLFFEELCIPYEDIARKKDGIKELLSYLSDENYHSDNNNNSPSPFAPPILKHGTTVISQTSNILLYLGEKLGLIPDEKLDPFGKYFINSLTLTILDGLSNEPHDIHHPIDIGLYYEDQKEEALRKAKYYKKNRLPKFLKYFENIINQNNNSDKEENKKEKEKENKNSEEWLYGNDLTYADLVLFQSLDGLNHALPKCMNFMKSSEKYQKVFQLYENVKKRPNIKNYLQSDRRQKYGMGIYRHYPELDSEE